MPPTTVNAMPASTVFAAWSVRLRGVTLAWYARKRFLTPPDERLGGKGPPAGETVYRQKNGCTERRLSN